MELDAYIAELRGRGRKFGPRYVVTDVALVGARLVQERIEDVLLQIEGERGVLGPAHQRWRDNSAAANRRRWDEWDWSQLGEEWTVSEDWKRGLVEDVLSIIPAGGTVVEIGPGGGRWSTILAPRSERLVVVDVSQTALDVVRDRLNGAGNVEFVLSPGSSLPGVEDGAADAVWSFDVFVHIAPTDQAAYLSEIARVLRPGGVAVVHHADGRNRGKSRSRAGWRAPMTAKLFASLARDRGLEVVEQKREWSDGRYGVEDFHDVITVLRRR